MSPHAIFNVLNGHSDEDEAVHVNGANGYAVQPHSQTNQLSRHHHVQEDFGPINPRRAYLSPTPKDELHDLVCVGFGPASLAIAIALQDELEAQARGKGDVPGLQNNIPKVAFVEKQNGFAWHSGMLIEGAKMQISYIKDMATLRNPRSHYTFLNYLYNKDRIVQFANLNTFLPQRKEFEDYLKWCADAFENVVYYGEEVTSVSQNKSPGGIIESFTVRSRNIHTGAVTAFTGKQVVIAVGGTPTIPLPFPARHPRIIHSSQFVKSTPFLLPNPLESYRVAVVGSGQSAAEIFDNLQARYPNSRTHLIIRGSALRPSDDSPFVNEIFDPERTAQFFDESAEVRGLIVRGNRNTNYGVVRLELLEKIYENLYLQRLQGGNPEDAPHRILNKRNVTTVDTDREDGKIHLSLDVLGVDRGVDHSATATGKHEAYEYDLVVVATGYSHDGHFELLKNVIEGEGVKSWNVQKDYRMQLEGVDVAADAGLWLQGCNEGTHGLADTLLSTLAVRGGEIVRSIWGQEEAAPQLITKKV